MPKSNNKSKRIREYLTTKPDAANSEIIEALGKFGVKYHDVTNVRASMRKKDGKTLNGKVTVHRGRPPKNGAKVSGGVGSAYESGIKFVAEAGSIESAIEILQVIRMIASSKVA